jgi:hypothetical protein
MSATAASVSKKFKLGAKPPKRLSLLAKQQLETSKPNKKAIERASRIVKLNVVDGSKYGL